MVRIRASRKDGANNGASTKIPIMQIVQILVVSILGLYVAFVLWLHAWLIGIPLMAI